MTVEEHYYDRILEITKEYLGPAAERFVCRQISSHLKKQPADLMKADIPTLAIRIRSGLMILTRDEQVVEEAYHRINRISDY
jgi:hypothetical protein